MVNGYVADPNKFDDFTRYDHLTLADPPEVVTAEYARHVAILSEMLLNGNLDKTGFSADPNRVAKDLEMLSNTLAKIAKELRETQNVSIEHFGD